MNQRALFQHLWRNLFHSALLVASLALVLGLLAWILAGPVGAALAVGFALGLWMLTPRIAPHLVLRAVRARRLQPWELPELHELNRVLAERAGLVRAPELWLQSSDQPNAFAVGTGDAGAIAVSAGLVRRLRLRELAGVLANETSHLAHGDTRLLGFAALFGRLTSSLALFGLLGVLFSLPAWLLGGWSIPWASLLGLLAAPVVSSLAQLALSRTREFDADRRAVELLGSPAPLAEALQRLEWHQRRLLAFLFGRGARLPQFSLLRTHPATSERLARLEQLGPRSRPLLRASRPRSCVSSAAPWEALWAAIAAQAPTRAGRVRFSAI